MPHFQAFAGPTEFTIDVTASFSPITGNTGNAGAAYDASTGKALWAVYHDSKMRCFRTIGAAETIIQQDDSVEEVGVIVDGVFAGTNGVTLSVIGDTLYANVTGHNTTANRAGSWLYRDTSGTTGAGPWVKHATFDEVTPSGLASNDPIFGHNYGAEVLVMPNGRWISSWAWTNQVNFDGTQRVKMDCGIGYSDDDGDTWQYGTVVYQGGVSFQTTTEEGVTAYRSVSIDAGPRSFGLHDGVAYCSVRNNSGSQVHLKSSDGETWTPRYSVASVADGNSVYQHPFSVGEQIWRAVTNTLLDFTTAAPETDPTYGTDYNVSLPTTSEAFAQVAGVSIGPVGRPLVAVTRFGKITGVGRIRSGGWTIGYVPIG